jgi:hypothetical protein
MIMRCLRAIGPAVLGAGIVLTAAPAVALEPELELYIGSDPLVFATPEEAAEALRKAFADRSIEATGTVLGLSVEALQTTDDVTGMLEDMDGRADALFAVEADEAQRVVVIGDEIWPFPFPIRPTDDGAWAFDTIAGLEEIINRRIGENEIVTIETLGAIATAAGEYASVDRDGDGVLEYPALLISSPGETDGLYWPEDEIGEPSPAGAFVSDEEIGAAEERGSYFGYRYKILTAQGDNVVGGAHDYIVNGNMVGGFAVLAWPERYGVTGVSSFLVNQDGVMYELDMGEDTDDLAEEMATFDPDEAWTAVED